MKLLFIIIKILSNSGRVKNVSNLRETYTSTKTLEVTSYLMVKDGMRSPEDREPGEDACSQHFYSEIKESAQLGLGENSFFMASRWLPSPSLSHDFFFVHADREREKEREHSIVSSHKGTNPIRPGPHPDDLMEP